MTKPPKGSGDFAPVYIKSANKLFWIRSNRKQANVWTSNPDGSNAKVWIKNVGSKDIPVDWYTADDVIEFYGE